MAKKKSVLEDLQNAAQYFTMSAAILAGVVWLVSLTGWDSAVGDLSIVNILMRIFVKATLVGGVAMGLFYLAKALKKK